MDRDAWLRACEAAYETAYRAVVAMGARPEDAADAVQDAFEQALRLRTPATKPEGWLFIVALRSWRRHSWRQRLFRPLELVRGEAHETPREGAIDLFVELRRLTERQRAVLVARYVLGLSQRETGELLAISPGTVAATAHQASQKLRERLGGP